MNPADQTEKDGAQSTSRIIRTFGEVFQDGSLLEAVASPKPGELDLLHCNGTSLHIGHQIEVDGRLYQAGELHESMMRVMRFPREPVGYGTTGQLYTELTQMFEEYLGFSEALAARSACWVPTTWFPDTFSSPPALWVSGEDLEQAAAFFMLLSCVCRRALTVTGLTRAGFLSLPLTLQPTLLSLSSKLQSLFCETNFRGTVIPGSRGRVMDVAGSKAIYVGTKGPPSPNGGDLHLHLFTPERETPPLNARAQDEIAQYFLPRLFQYRLDHAKEVREAEFVAPGLRFPTRDLACKLGACIQGDAELALRVGPLLKPEDDIDQCNIVFLIVEIILSRLHDRSQPAAAHMKIEAELTAEVNTLLLSRRETRQYSREEVGIRVANLRLTTKHTNAGTLLLLDRQTSRRVHELARRYGLGRVQADCADCQQSSISDGVTGV